MIPNDLELKRTFDECVNKRRHLESRWEEYAGWTLPYMYPTEAYTDTDELQNDFQAVGAQAVNHLTNKICLLYTSDAADE